LKRFFCNLEQIAGKPRHPDAGYFAFYPVRRIKRKTF